MADELEDWRAVAREHGGVGVYLERPDLPIDEDTGRPMLEPLILKIEPEADGLISLRLSDIAGNQHVMFLTYEADLDQARREAT